MKRIVLWLLTTVTIVVLLFGYRTSLAGPLAGTRVTVASSTGSTTGAARPRAPSPARWPRPGGGRSRSR